MPLRFSVSYADTVSHNAAASLPHFFLGVLFLLMAGLGIGEVLERPPQRLRWLSPLFIAVGGLGLLSISLLDAWVWHSEGLPQTAKVRAVVGGLLLIAGVAQGWGRSRGQAMLELPPQFAALFAGVLSAVREQVPADEQILHVIVAALVVISTLANVAAVMSGEPSRALRLFAQFLLASAAIGLLLFEPAGSTTGL